MQRYNEYKDSGVKWLGEIPSHWEVKRLKYVATYNDNVLPETENKDKCIKYIEISDVDNVSGIKRHVEYKFKDAPSRARRITHKGDVIVSTVRTYLKAIASIEDDDLIVSTGFAVIRANRINCKFLKHYLLSEGFINEVIRLSVGASYPAINAGELVAIKIPIPSIEEQETISTYLNKATSKIDAAIVQKQRMIELLNERKQIIINNAITKGLDPNVKMKDSGVQWIGGIPEHWDVKRGKYIFKIINDLSGTGEEDLLSVSDKTGVTPRSMKNVTMFMSESLVGYKRCFIGDICSNIMWMWHGAIGVTKYEGVISPSYGVYRQIKKVFTDDFLDILLRLPRLVKLYSVLSTGLTESRLRLYPADFLNIFFFIPPIDEQQRILDYIYLRCKPLDKEIKRLNDLITLLQERKQIIINDVVTGKEKVI